MPNYKVIINILKLLETMEEGLSYVKGRLTKLDIEGSKGVFADTVGAFSAVEEAITPMLDELEENQILEKTEELKSLFNLLVEEYEKTNGQKFYEIVQISLEPAFKKWKEEIELVLRPYVAS